MEKNTFKFILSIVIIFTLLIQIDLYGKIYQWTDDDGKVHYSDKPPEKIDKDKVKVLVKDGKPEEKATPGTTPVPGGTIKGKVILYDMVLKGKKYIQQEVKDIPSVLINFNSEVKTYSVYTDVDGTFQIKGIVPGVYNMEAQEMGFDTAKEKFVIPQGNKTYQISIPMYKSKSLKTNKDSKGLKTDSKPAEEKSVSEDIEKSLSDMKEEINSTEEDLKKELNEMLGIEEEDKKVIDADGKKQPVANPQNTDTDTDETDDDDTDATSGTTTNTNTGGETEDTNDDVESDTDTDTSSYESSEEKEINYESSDSSTYEYEDNDSDADTDTDTSNSNDTVDDTE